MPSPLSVTLISSVPVDQVFDSYYFESLDFFFELNDSLDSLAEPKKPNFFATFLVSELLESELL